jgi:hypothetical protein
MTIRKQAFSGRAGEHLVLGETLKRGVEGYLAHGKKQPGWDIVVVNRGGTPLRVQVKRQTLHLFTVLLPFER